MQKLLQTAVVAQDHVPAVEVIEAIFAAVIIGAIKTRTFHPNQNPAVSLNSINLVAKTHIIDQNMSIAIRQFCQRRLPRLGPVIGILRPAVFGPPPLQNASDAQGRLPWMLLNITIFRNKAIPRRTFLSGAVLINLKMGQFVLLITVE